MNLEWRDQASCRDSAPAFDFYVDGESPTHRTKRLEAALATCDTCPVKAQCAADIDPLLDDGVRAGQLLEKIKNVRAGGGRGDVTGDHRPKAPIQHGKPAGAVAHRRRGEKPCQLCREAESRYRQDLARKAS
jgi:isoaspartyl peptidase/L-asparaginase-like protein (Ntn-hydrolase superfamily)